MTRERLARLMFLVWAAMVVTACNPFGPSSSEALTFDFEFATPAPGADVLVVAPGILSVSAGSSFVVEVFDGRRASALLGRPYISNELGRSFFRGRRIQLMGDGHYHSRYEAPHRVNEHNRPPVEKAVFGSPAAASLLASRR